MTGKFTDAKLQAIRDLNSLKWNDKRIAEVLGVSAHTVGQWRKNAGIETYLPFNRIDRAQAEKLWADGESDGSIAQILEVDQSSVTLWRQKAGLPPHFVRHRLTDEDRRDADALLRKGASSTVVSAEIGCAKSTVMRLRRRIPKDLLRKTGVTDLNVRGRALKNKKLFSRITKAIGEQVPEHIREDAVYEMYADVLSCRLAAEQIEKRAPSYRSRAYDMCGSKYGAVSIDAEDENGFTLADRLADPAANDHW